MRRVLASSFGLGFIPRMLWGSDAGAGTFGAALGAAVGGGLLAIDAPWWIGLLAAAVAVAVSLWSAAPFATGGRDPGWVCMDETSGTLVALVGLSGWPWVVALGVARAADITKVLPGIRAAERLPGAVGVTADDLVAAGYGLALGWMLTGVGR
jgi:phosphatidylglycerophosphatase A